MILFNIITPIYFIILNITSIDIIKNISNILYLFRILTNLGGKN